MASKSLRAWQAEGRVWLDVVEETFALVRSPRRRIGPARRQIIHTYVLVLTSQFQRFCRDLHTESVDELTSHAAHEPLNAILKSRLTEGRKLDMGNPNSGNIGADFSRLGLQFWDRVHAHDATSASRKKQLDDMIQWRNAIAHHDFTRLANPMDLSISTVRRWRASCSGLAITFDDVLSVYLRERFGTSPWQERM